MLPVNSPTPTPSNNISRVCRDSLNPEGQDIWFDAIDYVEMEYTWFEGAEAFVPHEEQQADPSSSAGEAAESRVPFTEDCRRGVQQFVRTLGECGENRMLSACLSKILPGTPASLVVAANSLYTAVTERRNIDTAALHALGLASWYLPENMNVVSRLASFIRDTVTGWTNETFLHQSLGNEDNHTSIHLFTALAITAIVAGRWMKDEGAPQRGVLKIPAFMANIFIRASHYWTALGNMAGSLPSGAAIPENTGSSQHAPAFEVDTQVEMTRDVCDAAVSCCSSIPRLTTFSSNSTAHPEDYTRATVQNRPGPASGKNTHLSVPEQAHYLAMEKLRHESGLSELLFCTNLKTETRQQKNEKFITNTHFNTKCDATVYPEPLTKEADRILVHTDIPETQVSSAATSRSVGEPLLPIVMTTAAIPVATSYIQALKSRTVIAAGAAMGLTGTAIGGTWLWNKLSAHNPEGKHVNRADDIESTGDSFEHQALNQADPDNIHKNFLHRANHNVIRFLLSEGILKSDSRGKIEKETLLKALPNYLSNGQNNNVLNENNIKRLAQKILSGSGVYGEREKETLSSEQAKTVVRHWIFQNIIGASPEEYIKNEIKVDASRDYTVDDIHRLLFLNKLPEGRDINPDRLLPFEKILLSMLWKSLLIDEMPFLLFSEEQVKRVSLKNIDFANLFSGSHFLKDTGVKEFTPDEAILTGEKMWDLAISEGITVDNLKYYLLPAILSDKIDILEETEEEKMNDFGIVDEYLQYRQELSEVQKDIEEKYNKYISATKAWFSKLKLADYITSTCKQITLPSPYHSHMMKVTLEENRRNLRQKYLNGFSKPCEEAPDSLNDEYEKLTKNVADSFLDIDKYLIISAINALSRDERLFISNTESIMHPAHINMRTNYENWARYGSISFSNINSGIDPILNTNEGLDFTNDINTVVSLRKTELISVTLRGQERIYALMGDQGGYRVIRVDRDINKYIQSSVLDYNFGNEYTYDASTVKAGSETFHYSIEVGSKAIAAESDNILSLGVSLSNVHRDALFSALYESGNDKSDLQKIWSVVKNIIPFYDCVEGIVNRDPMQAVPACLLDAMAFIPLFGTAASLSGKFGVGLVRGLRSGAGIVFREGVQVASRNVLREVILPTTKELASLGKNALRSIDPGFELTGYIGSKFVNKITNLLSANKKTAGVAKKLVREGRTIELQQPASDEQIMGIIPGTELEIPVKAVGKLRGEDVYVRVNPETGMPGGYKYFCDEDGFLEPITNKNKKFRNTRESVAEINSAGSDITYTGHRTKRGVTGSKLCINPEIALRPIQVSEDLERLIDPSMFSEDVDVTSLSSPDHMGIMYDAYGNRYIKIKDKYLELQKNGDLFYIQKNNFEYIFVDLKKRKLTLSKTIVSGDFSSKSIANIDISKLDITSVTNKKNIYISQDLNLYIKISNDYYPIEFVGNDMRVAFIGSRNEIRFAGIYNPDLGIVKEIGINSEGYILKYNQDIDIYESANIKTGLIKYMRFDQKKGYFVNTNALLIKKINNQVYKVVFKKFELYIPKQTYKDVFLAAHACRDFSLRSQVPDNLEIKFYTVKNKVLHGYLDDLQDLVNGKFKAVEKIKGGEMVENYSIYFDHESQVNYAKLAMESKKSIIRIMDGNGVNMRDMLRDLSLLYNKDKTIHLYMCRSF